MDSKNFILLSAILFALNSTLMASNSNSWSAYSDTSSFRDVLQGRSYEETFGGGDPYDSLFSGGYGGGGSGGSSSSSSYAPQEKSTVRVIQQRSDSDYSSPTGGQRYNSPAVTVRSGQRAGGGASYGGGSNTQSSYGSRQSSYTPQTKTRQTSKGGYSKPSYSSTSSKTSQQAIDSDYESGGYSDITIPDTGFRCENRYYGYYADVEADCQVFHVCQPDGRKWSFLCPNGTLYHQKVQTCDWWFNVDCPTSPDFYFLNERIGVLPPQDATLHRF